MCWVNFSQKCLTTSQQLAQKCRNAGLYEEWCISIKFYHNSSENDNIVLLDTAWNALYV